MSKQYIKTNKTLLSVCLLLATSSFTLNGMQIVSKIKKDVATIKKACESTFNDIKTKHDAKFYNADNKLNTGGYVFSSLVALSIPAHILYTNPHALATLLDTKIVNETIKIAQNITPRIFFKTIDTLNVINKNYIIYGLKTSINNALSYKFQRLTIEKTGGYHADIVHVHPSTWFTDPAYHENTVSFTTNLITIASLAYLFYSAWYGNPEAKWKALAKTAGLQLWIRYSLHMAGVGKEATNTDLKTQIEKNHPKSEK